MTGDPWLDEVSRALRARAPLEGSVAERVVTRVRRRRARRRAGLGALVVLATAALGVAGITEAGTAQRFDLVLPGGAERVALVGDFNDWDASRTPMRPLRGDGRWSATVRLGNGIYRYAFLVDGKRWVADPSRPAMPDPDFGEPLSLLAVE